MSFLLIALAIAGWMAVKQGRPLKFVLTPEEARAVKARWWASAKGELRVFAVVFVIGFALLGKALGGAHWSPLVYVGIAWACAMCFCRLALWFTFAAGILLYVVGGIAMTIGHPIFPVIVPVLTLGAWLAAIIIRCPIALWFASAMVDSAKMANEHAKTLTENLHEQENDLP